MSSSVLSACCMLLRVRTRRRIMKWMSLIRLSTFYSLVSAHLLVVPPTDLLTLPPLQFHSCIQPSQKYFPFVFKDHKSWPQILGSVQSHRIQAGNWLWTTESRSQSSIEGQMAHAETAYYFAGEALFETRWEELHLFEILVIICMLATLVNGGWPCWITSFCVVIHSHNHLL